MLNKMSEQLEKTHFKLEWSFEEQALCHFFHQGKIKSSINPNLYSSVAKHSWRNFKLIRLSWPKNVFCATMLPILNLVSSQGGLHVLL